MGWKQGISKHAGTLHAASLTQSGCNNVDKALRSLGCPALPARAAVIHLLERSHLRPASCSLSVRSTARRVRAWGAYLHSPKL